MCPICDVLLHLMASVFLFHYFFTYTYINFTFFEPIVSPREIFSSLCRNMRKICRRCRRNKTDLAKTTFMIFSVEFPMHISQPANFVYKIPLTKLLISLTTSNQSLKDICILYYHVEKTKPRKCCYFHKFLFKKKNKSRMKIKSMYIIIPECLHLK